MNRHKRCEGCGHRRPITHSDTSIQICNYILDTGEPRGCSAENCTHYTTEKCKIQNEFDYPDSNIKSI